MKTLKILLIFLIVIILSFFVINSTYFEKNTINQNQIPVNKIGFYEIFLEDDIVKNTENTDNNFDLKKYYLNNISTIDVGYFKLGENGEYKLDNNNIIIKNGFYFFNFSSIGEGYLIKHKDFNLKPISPGGLLIDSTNEEDIKFFSIDSTFEVDFLSNENEFLNKVKIFPQISMSYNTLRKNFLKNTDLLRTQILTNITYNKYLLIDENLEVDDKNFILNGLKYSNDFKEFIKISLKDYYLKQKNFIKNARILKTTNIYGFNYIQKYYFLFINNEKKAYYLKNNIINDLNSLIVGIKNYSDLKNTLISNFELLKNIDKKNYDDFKIILDYYLKYSFLTNGSKDIDLSYNINELIEYYLYGNKKNQNKSFFYLSKMYNGTNGNNFTNYLQQNFNNFILSYLGELKIEIDYSNNKLTILDTENKAILEGLQYLSFYVRNILFNSFLIESDETFKTYLDVLINFYYINSSFDLFDNSKYKESNLLEFYDFYNQIVKKIRELFFEKELNESLLLVLKNDFVISLSTEQKIYQVIKFFEDYHKNNIDFLSQKNKIYNIYYDKLIKDFELYNFAIKNHEQYIINYDKSTSNLFQGGSIFQDEKEIELSMDNLKKYFEEFNGIDYSSQDYDFKVIDGNYYQIKNLNINGKLFSFDLYPKENNKLINIKIFDGIKTIDINGTYELDNLKTHYDLLLKSSGGDYDPNLDFKNIFSILFINNNPDNDLDNNNKIPEFRQESRIVSVFKGDKLFGTRGDFTFIKDILNIGYYDVRVEILTNGNIIEVLNGIIKTSLIVNGINENIEAIFTGNYNYETDKVENRSFNNVKLKIYDPLFLQREKTLLFGGNNIIIKDEIKILDFKEDINNIISDILSLKGSYNLITNLLGNPEITINYYQKTSILEFVFDNKNIKIEIKGNFLNSITVNDVEIIETNKKLIQDLQYYLLIIIN